jgi:hypothetical protein
MPAYRILACPVGTDRLPDEQTQRRQRRIQPVPVLANFLLDRLTQIPLRDDAAQRLTGLIGHFHSEPFDRCVQAFFWYLDSRLILLAIDLVLEHQDRSKARLSAA